MSEVEPSRLEKRISQKALDKLADTAEALARTYEPPHHIYLAMKDYERDSPDDRHELKKMLERILAKRQRDAAEQRALLEAADKAAEEKAINRDVTANLSNLPPATYDIEAEEGERSPRSSE